jgi:hypothetical protein
VVIKAEGAFFVKVNKIRPRIDPFKDLLRATREGEGYIHSEEEKIEKGQT